MSHLLVHGMPAKLKELLVDLGINVDDVTEATVRYTADGHITTVDLSLLLVEDGRT